MDARAGRTRSRLGIAAAAAVALLAAPALAAEDVVRELLRQQSPAERAGCDGVRRALAAGRDPALVVKTATELGYNACQVIRCALEGACLAGKVTADLAPALHGAAAAGVSPAVIARCAVEACPDPSAVAAVLAELFAEPSYSYVAPGPGEAPPPLPPALPVIDRTMPVPQASPFTF